MITHEGPHKYLQTKFKASGTVIYKCMFAGCTHFLYEPLILARLAICYRCGSQFIIVPKTLRAKKLHCEACCRGKYNKPKPRELAILNAGENIVPDQLEEEIEDLLAQVNEQIEREKKEKETTNEINN